MGYSAKIYIGPVVMSDGAIDLRLRDALEHPSVHLAEDYVLIDRARVERLIALARASCASSRAARIETLVNLQRGDLDPIR